MSYLEWNKFYNKIGSIGKPLRGSKFKIISDTGRQIKKPFFVGELIYFGKNVSLGYAKNLKDLRKGDINKGKLFTGDLAYIDNDNYYFIRGRKNRISKIFGIRIDLDDIEKELKKNSYKVKCVPDNQYLKILIMRNYNIETIRKIIQRYYGINKNFIHILKIDKFVNTNYFKEIKN
jgi:long-subunit acyl-CoA synthetase (AMP-forming)